MFVTTRNFDGNEGPWEIQEVQKNDFGLYLVLACGCVHIQNQKAIMSLVSKLGDKQQWPGKFVKLRIAVSSRDNRYIQVTPAIPAADAIDSPVQPPLISKVVGGERGGLIATPEELALCHHEPEIDPETRITYEIQTMTARHTRLLSHSKDEKLILERQMQNVREASVKVSELATQIAQVMDEFNKKQKMYEAAIKLLRTEISDCKDLLDRATQLLQDEGIPMRELVPDYEPITWKVPVEHLAALASQIEAADELSSPSVEYLFRMAHSLPIPKRLQRQEAKQELDELFEGVSEGQLVG